MQHLDFKNLEEFSDFMKDISDDIGFRVSSRGWAYILEQKRFINKDEFDKVTNTINRCRKKGFLPIDFTAEEAARDFNGVEEPDRDDIIDTFGHYLEATNNAAKYYTPDWWDGEEYYIQMVVEKIDLVTLFQPVCEEYHIPIANCFDSKTEILTELGWKRFDSLSPSTKVAIMADNGELIYKKPLRIVSDDYIGPMYHIENRAINQVITPNHNVYAKGCGKHAIFKLHPVSDVIHLQNLKFKRNIKWNGTEKRYFTLPMIESNGGPNKIKDKIDMDLWLELLGYYLSEGSLNFKKKQNIYVVQLAQNHEKIRLKMAKCVEKIGYSFYKDYQSIQISNKQLYTYLKPLGKCFEKYIPREFLNLSIRQSKILLDALIEGDGHVRENGRMSYATTSKRLSDDVQELALKAGYFASISVVPVNKLSKGNIRGRTVIARLDQYIVNISKSRDETRINHGKNDWSLVPYAGKIYCVEVPGNTIYVRRNGKPVWSGNSKGWSSMLQRAEYARRFAKAEDMGLECVLLYCGDHDPDGLRISEFIRKNLYDLKDVEWGDGALGYDPESLIIERFGLNYDFILENDFTWIDNLITGSGGCIAEIVNGEIIQGKTKAGKPHQNFNMAYAQEYLQKYGVRKCEANAIVVLPDVAQELVRSSIESYLGLDAKDRFQEKRDQVKDELEEFLDESGSKELLEQIFENIKNRPDDGDDY